MYRCVVDSILFVYFYKIEWNRGRCVDGIVMENLRIGQRYLFHMNRPFINDVESFRANVFAKYRETLVVNCCETERNMQTKVSMPLEWVKRADMLEDIVCENPILPSEILLLIDGYL